MNESTKKAITNSLKAKREEDLKSVLSELISIVDEKPSDDKESYRLMLGNTIFNLRTEYIKTFSQSTSLAGLNEIPKDSIELLKWFWDIQRLVNLEYENKFNDEVEKFWNERI